MSVAYDIRVATKALIVAASITNVAETDIHLRMMTKVTKGYDKFPSIIISPYGTISDEPADFGGSRDRSFRVRVAIVDAMSGDTETKDPLYSDWIEQIINAVLVVDGGTNNGYPRETLQSVPGVWRIRAEAINTFDDSKMMAEGFYSFQNAVFRFDWQ